eukprot:GSMAST32.ASY1.ANO1.365.1 assembled CDS
MTSSLQSLFSVAGKTVLVTGGARGIGKMIASSFVENGATVYLTSRNASDLSESQPGHDISSLDGCNRLADDLEHKYGLKELDVLVNNSGTSWGEEFDHSNINSTAGFDKVLDLNVKSIYYLTRSLLPLLDNVATQDDPARVINIGSIAGILPQSTPTFAYVSGVHHLTKSLSSELSSHFITVNAIAPGYIPSKMSQGLEKYATTEEIKEGIPLKRFGGKKDIAGAAIFLSSASSSWITGAIIPVDGGAVGSLTIPLV